MSNLWHARQTLTRTSEPDTDVSMEHDLSDNQRRLICRSAFVLFCALPTMIVTYFATHQRSADDWAKLIQAELGVETRIGAVETPRPGELILKNLKLFNDERKPILETLHANVSFGNTNRIQINDSIYMTNEAISFLGSETAGRLLKPMNGMAQTSDLKTWTVNCRNVEVFEKSKADRAILRSENLNIEVSAHSTGRKIEITDSIFGELEMTRNPDHFGQYEIVVRAIEKLPCSLVDGWFPGLKDEFGPDLKFKGYAEINAVKNSLKCRFTGDFFDLKIPSPGRNPRIVAQIEVKDFGLDEMEWDSGAAYLVYEPWNKQVIPGPETFGQDRVAPVESTLRNYLRQALRDVPEQRQTKLFR